MFGRKKRTIIGLTEKVVLENQKGYRAKIDTGAESSSIDSEFFKKLEERKIEGYKIVRSALGKSKRAMVMLEVEFLGEKYKEKFTIADRKDMKFKILIGKDILKRSNVIIDPKL